MLFTGLKCYKMAETTTNEPRAGDISEDVCIAGVTSASTFTVYRHLSDVNVLLDKETARLIFCSRIRSSVAIQLSQHAGIPKKSNYKSHSNSTWNSNSFKMKKLRLLLKSQLDYTHLKGRILENNYHLGDLRRFKVT